MNETHIPSKASTPPRQKSMTEILDEIEQRSKAATLGPWKFVQHWGPYNWQGAILHDTEHVFNGLVMPVETCTPEKDANAAFIAAARSDVPALVKALRRAVGALNEVLSTSYEGSMNCDCLYCGDYNEKADHAVRDISQLLTSPADHQMPLSEESPSNQWGAFCVNKGETL